MNEFDIEIIKKRPLVQCMTNHVAVNDCANLLLAVGASPVMAHHIDEVEEVALGCDALVLNLGATEDYPAMKKAVHAAKEAGRAIVVDPVGCGGISFRRDFFGQLMEVASPDCIRGNAAEICALIQGVSTSRGVDGKEIGIEEVEMATAALADEFGCIVVSSGPVDIISDGNRMEQIADGHAMMRYVTGMGCMSSALLGGYLGALAREEREEKRFAAVLAACQRIARIGREAAEETIGQGLGSMNFREKFLDRFSMETFSYIGM